MKNIVLLLFDIVSYISDKVKREDKKQHLILHSGAGCFCPRIDGGEENVV